MSTAQTIFGFANDVDVHLFINLIDHGMASNLFADREEGPRLRAEALSRTFRSEEYKSALQAIKADLAPYEKMIQEQEEFKKTLDEKAVKDGIAKHLKAGSSMSGDEAKAIFKNAKFLYQSGNFKESQDQLKHLVNKGNSL